MGRSYKRIASLIVGFPVLVIAFQNCGYVGPSDPNSFMITESGSIGFASVKAGVLEKRCASCHSGASPSAGFSVTSYKSVMTRVVAGNPEASVLMQRLADGSMPPSGPLALQELEQVEAWILAGAPEGEWTPTPVDPEPQPEPEPEPTPSPTPRPTPLPPGVSPTPTPPPTQPDPTATFSWVNANILQPRCISCHGAVSPKAGVRFTTYTETMKTVRAGTSASSILYTEVKSNSMPASGGALTTAQKEAIRKWIDAGALNN